MSCTMWLQNQKADESCGVYINRNANEEHESN